MIGRAPARIAGEETSPRINTRDAQSNAGTQGDQRCIPGTVFLEGSGRGCGGVRGGGGDILLALPANQHRAPRATEAGESKSHLPPLPTPLRVIVVTFAYTAAGYDRSNELIDDGHIS